MRNPDAETVDAARLRGLAARAFLPEPRTHNGHAAAAIVPPSDFDLDPDAVAELATLPAPRPAAVLVPVVARDELTVLLTVRTAHLAAHAGQIAFPGGKIDELDAGARGTALREAEEEIGLEPGFVEPLGYLDPYRTGTGYRITPVVGLVRPGFTLAINPDEVSEAFEVPLAHFLDRRNFLTEARTIAGRERRYYAIPYGSHYIWGATAGILLNLHRRLRAP
jgi:8-oxo-dGTP pyrophosphatase MutT (NUDIX family)